MLTFYTLSELGGLKVKSEVATSRDLTSKITILIKKPIVRPLIMFGRDVSTFRDYKIIEFLELEVPMLEKLKEELLEHVRRDVTLLLKLASNDGKYADYLEGFEVEVKRD